MIVHAYLQVIDFQESIITTADSLHISHASAVTNLKYENPPPKKNCYAAVNTSVCKQISSGESVWRNTLGL